MLMKWLTKFFKTYKYARLLEEENIDLKAKVLQAQENLNRTNSYWKKKIHNLKNTPKV